MQLPLPLLLLSVSDWFMAVLLVQMFYSTMGESNISYTWSEIARFYDLENPSTFSISN